MLRTEALAERFGRDELLEPRDERLVPAKRELRVVQELACAEVLFFQLRGIRLRDVLAAEIRERRPAPKPQRSRETLSGIAGVAGFEGFRALGHEARELLDVELARLEPEPITGPDRLDPVRAQGLAQTMDVDLQRLDG